AQKEKKEWEVKFEATLKKGIDIYMLVEEYPLSRGTLIQMLVAKLLVEQDNEISRELLRKIFMQAEDKEDEVFGRILSENKLEDLQLSIRIREDLQLSCKGLLGV
ncbi:hypothetical protein Tco_0101947, partial [Tanacetum coccineum]